MAASRAPKSGFAAEAQAKIMSKYNVHHAQEVLEWIAEVTNKSLNTSGEMDNFYDILKDGTVLCELANALKSNSIPKINTSTLAFKCMENIEKFLGTMKDFGVPDHEKFQTVDLWERQNLNSVVICLQALGRKAPSLGKPGIGPKESTKNVRNFSDEQLKASEGVIGLQMGSNKGATQSGINFGNTRHM